MRFTTITIRNIRRRPLRSALTLTAVAMAVCAVIALVGIATGFKDTFMRFYAEADIDLLAVRTGSARRLTSTMDASLAEAMMRVEGVEEVIPSLVDVVSFPDEGLYVVPVSGLVPETRAFKNMKMLSGRRLRKGDGKGVMLGIHLADSLGKTTGDTVEIVEDDAFEVIGVYEASNVIEDGSMTVSLGQLQRLMGREGQVTGFCIITEDSTNEELLDRIANEVEELESGITVRSTAEHIESLSEIQIAIAMARLTSTVALLIGAVGMLNTMFMSVQERTLEIGLLRAVGWSRGRVISMVLSEAVILSFIGAIVGTAIAFVLVGVLTRMPAVNGLIEGQIGAAVVAQGFLIALVVGFVGGLLPAIQASRLEPCEALRR